MVNYLPDAEPFFYPGNRVGCLLIHGFTGTPYEMRGLGRRLAGEGYTVMGPVLAGHATRVQDMVPTRWPDWYASVTSAYDQLRASCDVIFPIGLSLGADLALHLAAHRPVQGVVAASCPLEIQNPLIPLLRLPFAPSLIPYVGKKLLGNDTQDPTVGAHHPEYSGYPTRCAASLVLDLMPHVRDDLKDVRVPALLIQSHGDRTIPANSMPEIYARLGSAKKEMVWLDKSGHLVLEDFEKEKAFSHILGFVAKHIPAAVSAVLAAAPAPAAASNAE